MCESPLLCEEAGGDKFRRRVYSESPSCCRGCWPSQSQRLPRELRSLIARTIPFRVTYGNGPWNQRKNTNLISAVVGVERGRLVRFALVVRVVTGKKKKKKILSMFATRTSSSIAHFRSSTVYDTVDI